MVCKIGNWQSPSVSAASKVHRYVYCALQTADILTLFALCHQQAIQSKYGALKSRTDTEVRWDT